MKHKYAEDREAKRTRALAIAKKKGKPFNRAQRAEVQRRLDQEKADAEAAAKAAEEAAKAKADAEAVKAKAEAEADEAGSGE